jgi:hypothetical protein
MYIVRSGILSIQTSDGLEISKAKSGDVAGEMALLGLSPDGNRMRSSVCDTLCEFCTISVVHLTVMMKYNGFRVPLRRLLSIYVDGLACNWLESKKSLESMKSLESKKSLEFNRDDRGMAETFKNYAYNNIPWRQLKDRLKNIDKEHKKAALLKYQHQMNAMNANENILLPGHSMEQTDASSSLSFKRIRSTASAAKESLTAAEHKGSFSGGLSHAQKMENLKQAFDQVLKTNLNLNLRGFKTSNVNFEGRKRIVVACSWISLAPDAVKLDCTRSFTAPTNVMFKKGEGEIMSTHANSVILKLVLYHDAAQKWKQLGNVRFFVYEVIGAFTPPLPEDAFARLDQSDDDVGLSMSPEEIEAQEMVMGLCLLYHGSLSLEHLVRYRTNEYLKMTRKLIRKGQKNFFPIHEGRESPDSVKSDSQLNKPVICKLEPHVCRGGTKWDVPITQIHISSDVTRVLPMDSR